MNDGNTLPALEHLIAAAEERGWVHHVTVPVDPYLEMAQVIHALDEELTVFEAARGKAHGAASSWPGLVVAGLCSRRKYLALALGVEEPELLPTLVRALRSPIPAPRVNQAPCQEQIIAFSDAAKPWSASPAARDATADRAALPILTHFAQDGGPYITAGVAIVSHPQLGTNLSFHRLMQVGPRLFTARLVEGRGMHTAWVQAQGNLPIAVCIGAPIAVQLAAAMSPAPGVNEMEIANALRPTPTVKAIGLDLDVPAECEIVLEGYLTKELGDEGPFVDLTRTRDFVRQQPFFVVERITQRRSVPSRSPIYQALLPGGYEHKLLMGLPREPTIFDAVSKVCSCRNVVITPGGGYWLHAVVQIVKKTPEDGRAAIEAAFKGHSSLKHVVIVDEDVDPYDSEDVEWAIATRFQADRDLVIYQDQPGSSLDPSARHIPGSKSRTTKLGLDATIYWDTPRGSSRAAEYQVVHYGQVDLARYMPKDGLPSGAAPLRAEEKQP